MSETRDVPPAPLDPVQSSVQLRAALSRLPAYVPGKPAAAREGVQTYKVSSNENPYAPLPSVLSAVQEAAGSMNRYPDMAVAELTRAIADFLDVPPTCIATGTGSVGVLGQVISSTCDADDEVIYAWRSFEAYPIVTTLAGAKPVQVPLDADHRHRLGAMAEAITDRTRVILVCTPNNPTGTVVRDAELREFLARVPAEVLVVIDEAYLEFVEDADAPDALAIWREFPNVMVLRTFSKAYGLAGLRVGYAVAHEAMATALRQTAVPFGVNSLAQIAAITSLKAADELQERVGELVKERGRVADGLRDQGWQLSASQANFVWFDLGEDSGEFSAACEEEGLMVRQYGTDGVRVTIGEPEANSRLLEVCARWRERH
ncbi:MAG: histidinol-phosphate transaminase [Actinomycetia bacterium]|nr:histidinol-phosphate transaminase [Actinomycetes bacterium]